MKGAQIRAARVLLKWSQSDLAERALINRRTVANLENDNTLLIRTRSLPCGERSSLEVLHSKMARSLEPKPDEHSLFLHSGDTGHGEGMLHACPHPHGWQRLRVSGVLLEILQGG
jgi:transcriptional regulator with XRE-family HTH domain